MLLVRFILLLGCLYCCVVGEVDVIIVVVGIVDMVLFGCYRG